MSVSEKRHTTPPCNLYDPCCPCCFTSHHHPKLTPFSNRIRNASFPVALMPFFAKCSVVNFLKCVDLAKANAPAFPISFPSKFRVVREGKCREDAIA